MDNNKDTTNIKDLSFEAAIAELENIVTKLEQGAIPLEEAIDAYARGVDLKTHCNAKIKNATARVEKLTLNADGEPVETEEL